MDQPTRILCCSVFAASLFLLPTGVSAQSSTATDSTRRGPESAAVHKSQVAENYGRLPLSFEANAGQEADPRVKFLSRGAGYTLFLTPTEAVLGLNRQKSEDAGLQPANFRTGRETQGLVLRMRLLGANPHSMATGLEQLPGKSNYFIGNNSANWHTNVSTYGKVRFIQVYPGIDLVYYGNQRQLEYDFVVAPGADTSRIRLAIQGASKVFLDRDGDAVLHSKDGEIHLRRPLLYQEVGGKKIHVDGGYMLKGRELRFRVSDYDRSRALIIDPVLSYSTYLGGINSDGASGVAVDSTGNAYVVGTTSFTGFPVTSGAVQPTSHGTTNAFVAKLNASGTALVYSTYLGGSAQDTGYAIAVDGSGSAYVTGATISSDFPTTGGAFQTTTKPVATPGSTVFVTKLNPSGSSLAYSTYLGGNANDLGFAIAVDASGSAYVVGKTQSGNFPVRGTSPKVVGGPLACDSLISGGFDGFITKFSPAGDTVAYSLYLGGSADDVATGVAVDSSGNAYVAGYTASKNFLVFNTCPGPGPGPTSLQPANAGATNGFIVKVSPDGLAFLGSTYLGGSGQDALTSIAVDGSGFVYLAGEGNSGGAGGLDAIGAKLNGSLSSKVYFNYIGGSGFDRATGVAVDSAGNEYLVGQTASPNFPQVSPIQPAFGGGTYDAFVTELDSGGTIVFSTYLGGSGDEGTSIGGGPIAVDSSGNIYVVGSTTSTDFPWVSSSSIQPANGGGSDAFIVKLGPGVSNVTVLAASVNPSVFGQQVSISVTVSPVASSAFIPTGNVTFKEGSVVLGVAPLSNGTAIYNTSTFAVGTHNITATYTGDANFGISFAAPLSQVVNQSGSTTSLAAVPNPANLDQTVTLTAMVTATAPGSGTPSLTVTFLDGATTLGTGTLLNGQATFSVSTLTVGSHSLTVSYAGETNFVGSTSTALTEVIGKASSTLALSSSISSAVFGQGVTLTATAVAVAPATGAPGGTVTFLDGANTLGTVTLTNGQATFSVATLAVGSHSLTATYSGDTNFNGSTSTAQTEVVGAAASALALSSSPNPSVFGQAVTLTVVGSAVAPGSGTPTGAVTFQDGAATIGSAVLNNNGQAVLSVSALAIGAHSFTATYAGNANFGGSTSTASSQTVNQASSALVLNSSPNPSIVGQPVKITASVSAVAPGSGTPTGTVTFTDGGTTIGTATLSSGQTSISLSTLTVGSHSIAATYQGDSNFTAGVSAAFSQSILSLPPTTTTLSSSSNPALFGQSVTLTATVVPTPPGSGTPTGTVSFQDGATVLGTGALANGQATLSIATLANGGHTLVASYQGDANFSASTSAPLTQTVNQPSAITSINRTTFQLGTASSFTVAATGFPTPSLTELGALPTGVSFVDNHNGTATLSGTPAGGTAGTYPINLTAHNGAGTDGTQSFTLTAALIPSTTTISSSVNPSEVGQPVGFTVSVALGIPSVSTISLSPLVSLYVDGQFAAGSSAPITFTGSPNPSATITFPPMVFASSGAHAVTAQFQPNSLYINSSSGSLTQTVNLIPTTMTLSSSSNPSLLTQDITITATLTSAVPFPSGFSANPGAIGFQIDGGNVLYVPPVSAGGTTATATLPIGHGILSTGPHTITGTYTCQTTSCMLTPSSANLIQTVNNTTSGMGVSVSPPVNGTGSTPVSLVFSNVTQAGVTSLSISSSGTPPPTGFQLGNPPVYYNLSTTATFTGSVNICISYAGVAFTQPPQLFHILNGTPVNITTSVDATNMVVCGLTTSFSPFALLQSVSVATTTAISAPGVTYGTPASAVVSVGSSGGTVSGSVSLSVDGGVASSSALTSGSAVFNLGVLNAGPHSLSASFASQGNFLASAGSDTFSVAQAPLTIAANNAGRPYGANNPSFLPSFRGFVNGDSSLGLTGLLACGTAATPNSLVGMYPISCSGVSSPNYSITFIDATLAVLPETTSVAVAFSPLSIMVGQTTTATITLTAPPDMVIPINPSVLAPIAVSSPVASDILSNNGVCTPSPSTTPGVASCTITVTSVEPNGRTLNVSFPGSADLTASSGTADLIVTAALQSQQACIASDFRNVAVPGGSYVWFNSIFKVRDVTKQLIHISFFQSSAQFQYSDPAGNAVTVNRALPDAKITIDPNATAASTSFDAINNVWITTIPWDLDDNAFLTGMPWLVPSAGLPADVEPVTVCGTFASDVASVDIGWRWAAAAYSSFSSDNSTLGVKPMDTDYDNQATNHDHAGTPENYIQFVIPGARTKGGKNYTGTYSRSTVIE
jgi:hypothetical protein